MTTQKISDEARELADELEFPDCPVDLAEYGSDFQADWSRANAHARYINSKILQRALTDARQEAAREMRERCAVEAEKWSCPNVAQTIRALPVEGE